MSELRRKIDESAIAGADDVVKAVLLRDLWFEDTVLSGAEQVVIGIQRIELVILARLAFAVALKIHVMVGTAPRIQKSRPADVVQGRRVGAIRGEIALHVERHHRDIRLGGGDPGAVDVAGVLAHRQHREDADDRDREHDLDQREPCVARPLCRDGRLGDINDPNRETAGCRERRRRRYRHANVSAISQHVHAPNSSEPDHDGQYFKDDDVRVGGSGVRLDFLSRRHPVSCSIIDLDAHAFCNY
jgi:hypothetical protein